MMQKPKARPLPGVGGQKRPPGAGPKQAGSDEAEVGDERVPSGFPKP
jgi:hypothetical protein